MRRRSHLFFHLILNIYVSSTGLLADDGSSYDNVKFSEHLNLFDHHDKQFLLFASPDEMADRLTDKSERQKKVFFKLFDSALKDFDVSGYNWLMHMVMDKSRSHRFVQALAAIDNAMPHCDKGQKGGPPPEEAAVDYPGGPFRNLFGFDLTQWMTNLLSQVQSQAGTQAPGMAMMGMMSLMMVKGIIQSVGATIIDIVPPLIPPPVWINRPLPCLPMVTGRNCFGSILYPITISDFTTADVTDSVMEGVIGSFPAKYQNKVGKTSEAQYRACATAYLGLYCASIFPHCWMPMGMMEAQAQPVCFPQCIAVLVACPGFWLDDIMGPCSDVSIPPFCSFSIFLNHKRIPPLYTSYEDSHPFPRECPKFQPLYDIPDDLFEPKKAAPSPFVEEVPPQIPVKPKPSYNIRKPVHVEACNCEDKEFLASICGLHPGIQVHIPANATVAETHYQIPSAPSNECCRKCNAIPQGAIEYVVERPIKKVFKIAEEVQEEKKPEEEESKSGHNILLETRRSLSSIRSRINS